IAALDRWFRAPGHHAPVHHPPAQATAAGGAPAAGAASSGEFLDRLVADAEARRRGRPALRLIVHMGTCGRAVGAEDVRAARRDAMAVQQIDAEVIAGACSGMCYAAPAVEIARPGWPRVALERVAPGDAGAVVAALAGEGSFPVAGVVWSAAPWRGLIPTERHPFWASQERVLLARCGATDPEDLDDALLHGAYRALAGALARAPLDLIEAGH